MKINKDLVNYFSFGAIARAIPFVATIVFSHLLNPEEFGITVAFVSVVNLASSFFGFGIKQMVLRENVYFKPADFSDLVVSGYILSLSIMLVTVLLSIAVNYIWSGWVIAFELVILAFCIAFFQSCVELNEKILVIRQESRKFGLLQFMRGGSITVVGLALIWFIEELGLLARIYGFVIGMLLTLVGSFFALRKHILRIYVSTQYMVRIFSYGVRVFPQILAIWVKIGADKIIIASHLSLKDLGVYSIAFTSCSVLMIFGEALNNFYAGKCMPLYQEQQVPKLKELRQKMLIFVFLLAVILAILLHLMFEFIFPVEYDVSLLLLSFICLGLFFNVCYLLYMKYFLFKNAMSRLGLINMAAALFYIGVLMQLGEQTSLEFVASLFMVYNLIIATWVYLFARKGERLLEVKT